MKTPVAHVLKDIIRNIEAVYKYDNDPFVKKIKNILSVIGSGKYDNAKLLLKELEPSVRSKSTGYSQDARLKKLADPLKNEYQKAVNYLDMQKPMDAKESLNKILKGLMEVEELLQGATVTHQPIV